jgi:DNA-binding MarR family transcriptional regulator
LPPKDLSYLVVTLTSRAEIEQLTCKVIRECLKLKLAPFSVDKNAKIVDRLAKVLQLQ